MCASITDYHPLPTLFRAKVIHLLVQEQLLPPERVQILYSWKHSGFNVHAAAPVPPEHKADLEGLAQYILRNCDLGALVKPACNGPRNNPHSFGVG